MVHELGFARGRVACVVRHEGRSDPMAGEELARDAGVLGGHERHAAEDLERAQRDVPQIPDRRGDDVQRPSPGRFGHPWRRAEPGRRRG